MWRADISFHQPIGNGQKSTAVDSAFLLMQAQTAVGWLVRDAYIIITEFLRNFKFDQDPSTQFPRASSSPTVKGYFDTYPNDVFFKLSLVSTQIDSNQPVGTLKSC